MLNVGLCFAPLLCRVFFRHLRIDDRSKSQKLVRASRSCTRLMKKICAAARKRSTGKVKKTHSNRTAAMATVEDVSERCSTPVRAGGSSSACVRHSLSKRRSTPRASPVRAGGSSSASIRHSSSERCSTPMYNFQSLHARKVYGEFVSVETIHTSCRSIHCCK